MPVLFVLYAAAFAFLICTCYIRSLFRYYLLAKIMVSTLFMAIIAYRLLFHLPAGMYYIAIPFALCFAGDVLLGIRENAGGAPPYFIPGLVSFLCAHIGFCLLLSSGGALLRWQELIFRL